MKLWQGGYGKETENTETEVFLPWHPGNSPFAGSLEASSLLSGADVGQQTARADQQPPQLLQAPQRQSPQLLRRQLMSCRKLMMWRQLALVHSLMWRVPPGTRGGRSCPSVQRNEFSNIKPLFAHIEISANLQ
jgi:hypothetical protein